MLVVGDGGVALLSGMGRGGGMALVFTGGEGEVERFDSEGGDDRETLLSGIEEDGVIRVFNTGGDVAGVAELEGAGLEIFFGFGGIGGGVLFSVLGAVWIAGALEVLGVGGRIGN